jgi:valyl-tRNA synthetase
MAGQDIHWDETAVFAGKKFCNKIWNASRFVLQSTKSNMGTSDVPKLFSILRTSDVQKLTLADKKILKQLKITQKSVREDVENFRFGPALRKIYDFFWHQLCDIYIEKSKSQITNPKTQKTTKMILLYILSESLKILHPFMPFITEEIYQKIPLPKKNLLMIEKRV